MRGSTIDSSSSSMCKRDDACNAVDDDFMNSACDTNNTVHRPRVEVTPLITVGHSSREPLNARFGSVKTLDDDNDANDAADSPCVWDELATMD